MRFLDPASLSLDQPVLNVSRRMGYGSRQFDVFESSASRRVRLALTKITPGKVIERAASVRYSPMRHGASRIVFERLLEAAYPLRPIEGVAPVETRVEPTLSFC